MNPECYQDRNGTEEVTFALSILCTSRHFHCYVANTRQFFPGPLICSHEKDAVTEKSGLSSEL